MDNNFKLSAVAWAAHRAGMTYGKFRMTLTERNKEMIYRDYRTELARREREKEREAAERRRTRSSGMCDGAEWL